MADNDGHGLTHDELVLKKITRLEVGLFGIEGTDSRGLAGEIRDFKTAVTSISERVTVVETRCEERTATGDCAPVTSISKKDMAKAGGIGGGIGIVLGVLLDWLRYWLTSGRGGPSPGG